MTRVSYVDDGSASAFKVRWLPSLVVATSAVYICWNVGHIALGQVPPSMFFALTGVPCPTTGCTRSLLAMTRGDWSTSLLYNSFTIPYMLWLLAGLVAMARDLIGRRSLRLSERWWRVGIALLIVGWIAKLATPIAYW